MVPVLKFIQLLLLIAPILAEELDLNFVKFTVEPENNSIGKVVLDVKKTGKTSFDVSGSFEQFNAMGDEYLVEPTVYFSTDSEFYTKLTYIPKHGVCNLMQNFYRHKVYEKLLKACLNAPSPDTCPVPAAKYEVTKYKLDLKSFQGIIVQGDYKFAIAVFKGNKLEATFTGYFSADYS